MEVRQEEKRANKKTWYVTRLATALWQNITHSYKNVFRKAAWNHCLRVVYLEKKGRPVTSSHLQPFTGLQAIHLLAFLGCYLVLSGNTWERRSFVGSVHLVCRHGGLSISVSAACRGSSGYGTRAGGVLRNMGKAWAFLQATPTGKQDGWRGLGG